MLHFLAAAADSSSDCCCTLSCRLYLCIRFGCAGFSVGFAEEADEGCGPEDEAALEPGGGGGWKVMGGFFQV